MTTTTRTRACTKRREPTPLFPAIPHADDNAATIWRTHFLRDLAMLRIGEKLKRKADLGCDHPTSLFLYIAVENQNSEVRMSFNYWMGAAGGMVGGGL